MLSPLSHTYMSIEIDKVCVKQLTRQPSLAHFRSVLTYCMVTDLRCMVTRYFHSKVSERGLPSCSTHTLSISRRILHLTALEENSRNFSAPDFLIKKKKENGRGKSKLPFLAVKKCRLFLLLP